MSEAHEFFFTSAHPLSQWFASEFMADGIKFNTAENFMMYRKALLFGDVNIASKLIDCHNPKDAKAYGRQIRGFNEDIWEQTKRDIVFIGNIYKFSQSAFLRHYLINTGKKELVEASPWDKIWGIGLSEEEARKTDPGFWPGQNLLGRVLMQVREVIQRCA